jgi:hypothetical protein
VFLKFLVLSSAATDSSSRAPEKLKLKQTFSRRVSPHSVQLSLPHAARSDTSYRYNNKTMQAPRLATQACSHTGRPVPNALPHQTLRLFNAFQCYLWYSGRARSFFALRRQLNGNLASFIHTHTDSAYMTTVCSVEGRGALHPPESLFLYPCY